MKKALKVYFILTGVCIIIDLLVWLSSISSIGTKNVSPYADTALLAFSTGYVILDGYYLAWVNSLRYRVPPYVSVGFMQAALGQMDRMYYQIGEKIKSKKL